MDLNDWKEMTLEKRVEALLGMVAALRDSLVEIDRATSALAKNLSDNDQKLMAELTDQRARIDAHGKAIGIVMDALNPQPAAGRIVH